MFKRTFSNYTQVWKNRPKKKLGQKWSKHNFKYPTTTALADFWSNASTLFLFFRSILSMAVLLSCGIQISEQKIECAFSLAHDKSECISLVLNHRGVLKMGQPPCILLYPDKQIHSLGIDARMAYDELEDEEAKEEWFFISLSECEFQVWTWRNHDMWYDFVFLVKNKTLISNQYTLFHSSRFSHSYL